MELTEVQLDGRLHILLMNYRHYYIMEERGDCIRCC